MNQNQKKIVIIALIAFALIVYIMLCVCGLMIFRKSQDSGQAEFMDTQPDLILEETLDTETLEPTAISGSKPTENLPPSAASETENAPTETNNPESEPTLVDDAEIVTSDDLSENQKTVIAAVERIRGLRSEKPLRIVYKSRDELREETIRKFEENLTDEDFANDRDLLSLFGFIEDDFDVKDFYIKLQTEQVAGYYNSKENIMMLPREADEAEILNTLSHEYTHFLQFSNFPELEKYYEADFCKNNSEECLLGKAMIEGDAVLTEMLTSQEADVAPLLRGGTLSQNSRVFDRAPKYLQEALLLEYTYGFNFMMFFYADGGFASVNEKLLAPPTSVEQLANPLLVGVDEPTEVSLDRSNAALESQGCDIIQTNVLNIVDLRWMLTLGVDKDWRLDGPSAERATDGWSGGAFSFGRCDGEPFIFAETQWDSRREAREFSSGLDTHFTARYGDADETGLWEGDDRLIRVIESDSSVYFWIVPEALDTDSLAEGIGIAAEETKVEETKEAEEEENFVEVDL